MNKAAQLTTQKATNARIKCTLSKIHNSGVVMALLPLAACKGGGASAPADDAPPSPVAAENPQFAESVTNVFTAIDDSDSTFSAGGSDANLTVVGKAGSDSITTGSGTDIVTGGAGADTIITNDGNDMIRAGDGADTVTAGAGDDAIVVVGTTGASEYTTSSITNSGGTGMDLSSLITLADLNGRTVSEVQAGETIDGGSGTNTLYIYGTVDLTGVTLNNVTVLVVNSDVTLTPEQIAQFTTVDGDGSSVINIEIPEDSDDNYILDLSVIDLSDVATINIEGDLTVQIDDVDDLGGVTEITSATGAEVTLDIVGGTTGATVDVEDIAEVFETVDNIVVQDTVTLVADDGDVVATLGLEAIYGTGDVDDGGTDALDNVTYDPAGNPTDPNQAPNNPATGSVSISGVLIEGNTLTAESTLEDADGLGTFQYSWYRGDDYVDVGGSNEYTLTSLDVGKEITLQIDYIDGAGYEETHFSPNTETIATASFVESPSSTYTANGDVDLDLQQPNAINDLTVFGRGGNDSIITGNGNDLVFGGGGNDIISSDAGNDEVHGGDGNDTISVVGGTNTLNGDAGDDEFLYVSANDTVDGGTGDDFVLLSPSVGVGTIDVTQLDFSNIETLDIYWINGNDLLLTVQDVLDVTDENNTLAIDDITGNNVVSIGEGWVQGDDVIEESPAGVFADDVTYHSYTSGDATLLIHEDVWFTTALP